MYNNRVRKIDKGTGIISTVAGSGTSGYSGDGGLAVTAELDHPSMLHVSSSQFLYISDYNNHRVRRVDLTSGVISNFAGNGYGGFSSDGGMADTTMIYFPTGITSDTFGNVYLADSYNYRLRKINTFGVIQTIIGNGAAIYTGEHISGTAAAANPIDVTIDDSSYVVIADNINSRVRKLFYDGTVSTIVGNGVAGYNGDTSIAINAEINKPQGVTYDKCGNLYVGDAQNSRIRKVTFYAYSTPTVTVTGMSSATVGATVSVHAAVSGGVGAYRINWYRNGTLLAVTDTPGVTYIKGMGTDTISAHALPSVVYCSDSAVSPVWEVSEIPVGITDVRRMGVTIYPNPTSSMLHVNGEGPLEEVALETVTGQAIVNMRVQGMRAEMDMSGLPAGLYLLRVNRLQVYKVWRE